MAYESNDPYTSNLGLEGIICIFVLVYNREQFNK